MRLALVVLRVADIERSRAFYTALGMTLVPEQHGGGPRHYSATLGDCVLEIYPGTSLAGLRLGFDVDDLERVRDALALGGTLITPATERNGRQVCIVTDPDGHKVELAAPSRSVADASQSHSKT